MTKTIKKEFLKVEKYFNTSLPQKISTPKSPGLTTGFFFLQCGYELFRTEIIEKLHTVTTFSI